MLSTCLLGHKPIGTTPLELLRSLQASHGIAATFHAFLEPQRRLLAPPPCELTFPQSERLGLAMRAVPLRAHFLGLAKVVRHELVLARAEDLLIVRVCP